MHGGIAIMAVGIIGSSAYDVKNTHSFKPGDSYTIEGYTITYSDLVVGGTQKKMVVTAKLEISSNGQSIGKMDMEKDYYSTRDPNQPQIVTKIGLRSTLAQDLYIIMAGWDQQKVISLEILVNPLVMWIWIGGWVLLAGGLICFWPQPGKTLPVSEKVEPIPPQQDASSTTSQNPAKNIEHGKRKSNRRRR